MRVLFDREIEVHYGYAFVGAVEQPPDLPSTRRQANGLVGGAVPGVLSLVTGLHTGGVPLRIEWFDSVPPSASQTFQDVVEVSFEPTQTGLSVWTFQEHYPFTIPKASPLRARYCVAGMDAGNDMDTRIDTAPVEWALLQLWPAPAEPDRILRADSRTGSYWHAEVETQSR